MKGSLHQPARDAWRRPKRRRGASVRAYICECASSRAMREEGVCAQTLRRTDRQAGRQTDTEYPGCGQCAEDKKFNTISCTKRNWKRIYTARVGHSCCYLVVAESRRFIIFWANGSVGKNKGGDTTTRTGIETAGSGKDLVYYLLLCYACKT